MHCATLTFASLCGMVALELHVMTDGLLLSGGMFCSQE
jgi:hypothetical protein